MEIILKSLNSKHFQTISLDKLDDFHKVSETLKSSKGPVEANLLSTNETITSHQLICLKSTIQKLNISSFRIFSNNRETILSGKSLKIDSTFIKKNELKNKLFLKSEKPQKELLHKGTVRSGDRISSNGDLIILGDVNPGAIVSAKNNVYVWGKLLGIALAGAGGNKSSTIASLYLNPLQLRISDFVAIGPKEKPKNYYPEIALLEEERIIIKPLIIETKINQ